jgi:hypothetical protein
MNQYRCETFETLGGIKKASKYRCETCGFNKPIGENGKYCSKASEISVIFMPEDDSNMYLGCASHSDFQSEREKVLDELYPPNTHVEKNGDLYGGWEIEPKSLIRLKRYIQSNPQYEEEPDMEVIEVVIRAIKHELKYGKEELRQAGE